jgi:hypothetical protein
MKPFRTGASNLLAQLAHGAQTGANAFALCGLRDLLRFIPRISFSAPSRRGKNSQGE